MDKNAQVIDHSPQAQITLSPVRATPNNANFVNKTYGGLRCRWDVPHRPGSQVRVEVAVEQQRANAVAAVTHCHVDEEGYCIELGFLDPEQAFQMRMMEQFCHIQQYQDQVSRREGRRLDGDEAAQEWIALFAEDFPAA